MKYSYSYSANHDDGRFHSRWFTLHKITAFSVADGREAGYITISYIPSSTGFANSIIGQLNLQGTISGYLYDKSYSLDTILVKSAWSLLNKCAMSYDEMNRVYEMLKYMSVWKAADYIREHILPEIEQREMKKWQWDIAYHVDKPKVDFIRVHEPYRGSGLAEQLYYRAAKWMKSSFNLPMRFSTLQCDDRPKRVMQRFIDRGMVEQERFPNIYDRTKPYTFNWIKTDRPLWLDHQP